MRTFLIFAAATLPSSAFACNTGDIQKYITQLIKPEAVQGFCRDHGGSVTKITAGNYVLATHADSTTATGHYVVQCVNGDLLVGTLNLDAKTCFPKLATTEPTVQIFP